MTKKVHPEWLRFGRELRRLRKQAGQTQEQLGKAVSISYGSVSAFERAVLRPKLEHVERMDAALSSDGALVRMWNVASKGNGLAAWFRGLAALLQQASELREYNPMLVPGLMQTPDYARTILRAGQPADSDADIEAQVHARVARQAVIESDRAPLLIEVLDEAVLRRPIGGRDVMKRQLERLIELSTMPRVAIHVIPLDTEQHPGLSEAFSLFRVPERSDTVYIETRLAATAIDEPSEVAAYVSHFGDLRGAALPLSASQHLIERIRGEFK
jgi:transcriptional regulator with XRE-family HTH domain